MRVLFLVLAAAVMAAAAPAPGKGGGGVIDAVAYPDDAAARAAWKPMSGSSPVSVVTRDGVRALRMPCTFAGNRVERAAWDLAVSLDLAAARGIRFRFLCPDLSPVSHFSLYFQSRGGWYVASFSPERPGWNTIHVDKEETRIEGTPGGWGAVRTIRLSAWRGAEADTDLFLADLRVEGADAALVVLRADSTARLAPGESESARRYARAVTRALRGAGLPYAFLSDLDVTAGRLRGRKLVFLPHNPVMPDATAEAVARFLKGGGRLIAFYCLPKRLQAAAGVELGRHLRQARPGHFAAMHFALPRHPGMPPVVRQRSWNIREAKPVAGRGRAVAAWHDDGGKPAGHAAVVATDAGFFVTHVLLNDDAAAKRRMLLAMTGHLVPPVWDEAVRACTEAVGRLGPYGGFDEARAGILAAAAGRAGVREALATAAMRRSEALALGKAGKGADAVARLEEARRLVLESYCRAQTAAPGEHRAFWCHTAHGAGGLGWDEAVKRLAANGFNAVIPNMLWGGLAYYPSEVLPVAPEVREGRDLLAECLAACRKHGVRCHVWKVNWNMAGRAPRAFAERMKREGRTQVKFDGTPGDQWLCPSHPANRALERDAMLEVVSKYAVDGIHFDYIRYPGRDGCYCPGCRGRFEAAAGTKVARWPQDLRADGGLEAKWLDFRRDQITALVAAVSAGARERREGVKLSAAVFANWPVDRDLIGQDWKLWCERGYLDFVCPMDYTPHDAVFENLVARQVRWAGKVPCYPGIGLSVWSPADDVVNLIGKIRITRRLGTGGFTVFDYAPAATQAVLPLCGLGVTRRE